MLPDHTKDLQLGYTALWPDRRDLQLGNTAMLPDKHKDLQLGNTAMLPDTRVRRGASEIIHLCGKRTTALN